MTHLDKLVEMLSSPNAGKRYDACEELRVTGESSVAAVTALEHALNDTDHEVAERAKRALIADVHRAVLLQLGRPLLPTPEEIAARDNLENARALAGIVMVTTYSLDTAKVMDYLGIVTAEVVLGTGLLTEVGGGIADLLGIRAGPFQAKLREAKEQALRELRMRAFEMHANAILGVDLDYAVLGSNMLMVVANGTAVKTEPIEAKAPTK
jgi:uncharacterized protein YbjQ (UPF0145 family)